MNNDYSKYLDVYCYVFVFQLLLLTELLSCILEVICTFESIKLLLFLDKLLLFLDADRKCYLVR